MKLYLLKRATCDATVKKVDEFTRCAGKPQKILANRGTQFTSRKLKEAFGERNRNLGKIDSGNMLQQKYIHNQQH